MTPRHRLGVISLKWHIFSKKRILQTKKYPPQTFAPPSPTTLASPHSSALPKPTGHPGGATLAPKPPQPKPAITGAIRITLLGLLTSLALAAVKLVTGIVGHSNALIADGIESISDVVISLIVIVGLRASITPPDERHPYGHGGAETFAGLLVALSLIGSAIVIAIQCVEEIRTPHELPAWYTLPVLILVIITKLILSRKIASSGRNYGSSAMEGDAWHHAADAITSAAAFIGISIAFVGGPGWEAADDWAALLACAMIVYNAILLLRRSFDEVMDAAVSGETAQALRDIAGGVEGVEQVEKCRIRKSGTGLLMDIHIEVHGELTVTEGHDIAGAVKSALMDSTHQVRDVVVHIEPHDRTEN